MKALSVQGGGETSSKISVRVGGRVAMIVCRDDGEGEMNMPLTLVEDLWRKELQSSKADRGTGTCSFWVGMVK